MKRYPVIGVFALALASWACVSAPIIEKPQFTNQYYTFSILLTPEKPSGSPQLDIALSLLKMEYPEEQAQFLHNTLYARTSPDAYKDRIIIDQRENYRRRAFGTYADTAGMEQLDEDGTAYLNWRYAESVSLKRYKGQGMVIERNFETYSGGAHPVTIKQYYNIDMEEQKLIDIDDFFASYQEEKQLRDIIYAELQKYSKLERTQSLSEGIFFQDEPELSFNCFIAGEGLGLHWDSSQIAPHSEGSIEIILPWDTIRPLMKYTGIELLTKFNIYLFI